MKKVILFLLSFNAGIAFGQAPKLQGTYTEYEVKLLNGDDGSKVTFNQKPFVPSLQLMFIPDSNIVLDKTDGYTMRKFYTIAGHKLTTKYPMKRGTRVDTAYNVYIIETKKEDLILKEYKEGLDDKYYLKKHYLKKGELPQNVKDDSGPKEIYTIVEEMPMYPGGTQEMFAFINKEINYPKHADDAKPIEKVFLKILVDPEGKLENVEILANPRLEFAVEAMKVVRKFPAFSPGKQNGKAVYVYYNIPITF
jgi:hypothetical protein